MRSLCSALAMASLVLDFAMGCVAGQIEGSALMGQGFALCEEIVQRNGVLLTPSFSEYLIPTAEDMPETKAIILESRSGLGPFGAKGMGESAFAPVAASIANAVADAIGVRVFDLPITPERVIMALERKRATMTQAPSSPL